MKEITSSTQWNRDLVGGHQNLPSFVPGHNVSTDTLDIVSGM